MKLSHSSFRSRLALIGAIAIATTSIFAFAAANTVPVTGAGEGTNVISGYETRNVSYKLQTTDPEVVDHVEFALYPMTDGQPAPTDVRVKVVLAADYAPAVNHGDVSTGTTWWFTPTASTFVSNTDSLSIVAVQ